MKKSELNKYIKENILSELSESTEDEIAKTKELTSAVKDLESAKKEAGIEEANIGLADLEEMGYEAGEKSFDMHFDKSILKNRPDTKSYAKGFVQAVIDSAGSLRLDENEGRTKMPTQDQVNKFFSLTQNEMHYLNSKPVAGQEKTSNDMEVEPWDEYDLSNFNSLVRKAKQQGKSIDELKKSSRVDEDKYDDIVDADDDIPANKKKEAAIAYRKVDKGDSYKKATSHIKEEDEVFNPDAKVKKTKGLSKAKEELALLTREMKSLAKKYSKAEGADKEKLVKILKDKTKLKKELESILDNKKI